MRAKKTPKKYLSLFLSVLITVGMFPTGLTAYASEKDIHSHTEVCYCSGGELVCELEESPEHSHEADCYCPGGELVCELEESAEDAGKEDSNTEGDEQIRSYAENADDSGTEGRSSEPDVQDSEFFAITVTDNSGRVRALGGLPNMWELYDETKISQAWCIAEDGSLRHFVDTKNDGRLCVSIRWVEDSYESGEYYAPVYCNKEGYVDTNDPDEILQLLPVKLEEAEHGKYYLQVYDPGKIYENVIQDSEFCENHPEYHKSPEGARLSVEMPDTEERFLRYLPHNCLTADEDGYSDASMVELKPMKIIEREPGPYEITDKHWSSKENTEKNNTGNANHSITVEGKLNNPIAPPGYDTRWYREYGDMALFTLRTTSGESKETTMVIGKNTAGDRAHFSLTLEDVEPDQRLELVVRFREWQGIDIRPGYDNGRIYLTSYNTWPAYSVYEIQENTTTIPVSKVWDDGNLTVDHSNDSVKLRLKQSMGTSGPEQEYRVMTLTSDDDWKGKFCHIPYESRRYEITFPFAPESEGGTEDVSYEDANAEFWEPGIREEYSLKNLIDTVRFHYSLEEIDVPEGYEASITYVPTDEGGAYECITPTDNMEPQHYKGWIITAYDERDPSAGRKALYPVLRTMGEGDDTYEEYEVINDFDKTIQEKAPNVEFEIVGTEGTAIIRDDQGKLLQYSRYANIIDGKMGIEWSSNDHCWYMFSYHHPWGGEGKKRYLTIRPGYYTTEFDWDLVFEYDNESNVRGSTKVQLITGVKDDAEITEAHFTVTNTRSSQPKGTGSLMVSKTVGGSAASKTKNFSFTVTLDNSDINGTYGDMTFAGGVAAFTLKAGESKTASNLPAGVNYTVKESDNAGYTVTVNGTSKTTATGTIAADSTVTAAFHNHKSGGSGGSDSDDSSNSDNPGKQSDSHVPGKPVANVPPTGDNSNTGLWIALACLSLLAMAVALDKIVFGGETG